MTSLTILFQDDGNMRHSKAKSILKSELTVETSSWYHQEPHKFVIDGSDNQMAKTRNYC